MGKPHNQQAKLSTGANAEEQAQEHLTQRSLTRNLHLADPCTMSTNHRPALESKKGRVRPIKDTIQHARALNSQTTLKLRQDVNVLQGESKPALSAHDVVDQDGGAVEDGNESSASEESDSEGDSESELASELAKIRQEREDRRKTKALEGNPLLSITRERTKLNWRKTPFRVKKATKSQE